MRRAKRFNSLRHCPLQSGLGLIEERRCRGSTSEWRLDAATTRNVFQVGLSHQREVGVRAAGKALGDVLPGDWFPSQF